jgi:hypothetical protein
MKRPSFQFYPGDWQANSNLRRCSHAEKGAWVDVMCLLHDQPEYGVLRWPLKEIAQAVGCTAALLRGIVVKEVLKGSDTELDEPFVYVPRSGRKDGEPVILLPVQPGPVWFSSRMVRDEYIRTVRGESTRFGESGEAPKRTPKPAPKVSPKPPFGDGSSPSSSSSSSPSVNTAEVLPPSSGGGAHEPDLTGFTPTPAGLVCRQLRDAGLPDAAPGNLRLTTLLDAGARAEEFLAFANEAMTKDKPFLWLLGAVEGERKRAKATAGQLHRGPMPAAETATQRAQRERAAAFAPSVAARAPAADPFTIDAEVTDVTASRLG